MNFQDILVLAIVIISISFAVAWYYITKYRRLVGNVQTMCHELIQIRRQLYSESTEQAHCFVTDTVVEIVQKAK